MVESNFLSDAEIEYFLRLHDVLTAKERIDSQTSGSVYFTVQLVPAIKEALYEKMGIDLSNIDSIPMRWIKGDTRPHIDTCIHSFDKTHLAYLTDSPGELMIDGVAYPITRGNTYIFSEGLSHETIGTGSEPRLLLGPMSENGVSVGSSISGPGGTTIYFRQNIADIQYSTDQISWISLGNNYPISVYNTDTNAGNLKIEFITNITFDNTYGPGIYKYFVCSSDNIQFGSESLNNDGSRPVITVDVDYYDGLIQNGNNTNAGYSNIYVYNLIVDGTGHTTQIGAGWIGKNYFGNGTTNNYIINCSSFGDILSGSTGSGGILGSHAGSNSGTLNLIGCSSSGAIGINCGGIVGGFAGADGGSVTCEKCWSTGSIDDSGSGIFGIYSGYNNGTIIATNCYSTGSIGTNAGGIFGGYSGYNGGSIQATNCYSTGNIDTNGGGIYGTSAGLILGTAGATNCYSSGTITTSGNGIFGSGPGSTTETNCYSANGNWISFSANTNLTGFPITPNTVGTWVYTGLNQPYELSNMGYTPYTINNITTSGTPSLVQTYTQTISAGTSSIAAIVNGKSYTILQISGGNPSYGTITINNNTGTILTTSGTLAGIYTVYIRNTGSYNVSTFTLTVTSSNILNQTTLLNFLNSNNSTGIIENDINLDYNNRILVANNGLKTLVSNTDVKIVIV